MPNWVENTIYGYTPEMKEKYSAIDEYIGIDTDGNIKDPVNAISFQKIIPMPEELKTLPSGSLADDASAIYEFDEYLKNTPEEERSKYDSLELDRMINNSLEQMYKQVGKLALLEPTKTLNQILSNNDNSYLRERVDMFKEVTNNIGCRVPSQIKSIRDTSIMSHEDRMANDKRVTEDRIKMLERYSAVLNKTYLENKEEEKNSDKKFKAYDYPYDSLLDMGKCIAECKEKYGAGDWYKWRCANWGTKWDAGDIDYNEETQELHFSTAWAPPEQIFAKIQDDFPDAKLSIYSEEETGWFNEYETKDDHKIHQTIDGEYQYNFDDNGDIIDTTEVRNEVDRILSYDTDQKTLAMFNRIEQKFR